MEQFRTTHPNYQGYSSDNYHVSDEKADRRKGEPYQFQIKTDEPAPILARRIKSMYAEAQDIDPEIFKDPIKVDDRTLKMCVSHLEGINFNATDLDTKGVAFEQFLDGFFKGDFGQYFITHSTTRLPDVQASLEQVNAIYNVDEDLKTNHCVGLFHAFVYFSLTDKKGGRLKSFQNWVKGNHLAAMKSTDANALIEIFERVHTAKARTIFVSMQFGDSTEFVYDTIKKTVEEINMECNPKIKIEPLRIDKLNMGHSYTITDEILAAIEQSGLLIADLSQGNKNVYHEIGYMMGLNRGKGLKQENFILIARDRPEDKLEKKMGFNLKGISQIRFKESIDLERALRSTIKEYYGLS
jgi:hypothetical protein